MRPPASVIQLPQRFMHLGSAELAPAEQRHPRPRTASPPSSRYILARRCHRNTASEKAEQQHDVGGDGRVQRARFQRDVCYGSEHERCGIFLWISRTCGGRSSMAAPRCT